MKIKQRKQFYGDFINNNLRGAYIGQITVDAFIWLKLEGMISDLRDEDIRLKAYIMIDRIKGRGANEKTNV